ARRVWNGWGAAGTEPAFGLGTAHVGAAPLRAARCGRLQDAGIPVTPARGADLARALTLVRPLSRRRLYWTARPVLVTDPAQVPAFDRVFLTVFGDRNRTEPFQPDEVLVVTVPDDEQPAIDRELDDARV